MHRIFAIPYSAAQIKAIENQFFRSIKNEIFEKNEYSYMVSYIYLT